MELDRRRPHYFQHQANPNGCQPHHRYRHHRRAWSCLEWWTLVLLVVLAGQIQGFMLVQAKVFATQMSPRVITTQYGKLRGVLVTLPSRHLPQVEAYLGLQYASVLGGELRFMPPTSPMETWDGIRVALKFRPVCPQQIPTEEDLLKRLPVGRVEHFMRLIPFLERQAEECLNLNIYVPVRGKPRISKHPQSHRNIVLLFLIFRFRVFGGLILRSR